MEKNFIPESEDISILKKEGLSPEEKALIDEGFAAHAMSSTGYDGDIREFALVAKRKGAFIGALTARLFWGSLHIKHLFVLSDSRNKGVGQQLMEAALKIGKENHCRFAAVETMSFQALDFYRKLGFKIDFSREGYDKGCTFHYLSKPLT